jgi:hypothetical protein
MIHRGTHVQILHCNVTRQPNVWLAIISVRLQNQLFGSQPFRSAFRCDSVVLSEIGSVDLGRITDDPAARKNSMKGMDPSFECSVFAVCTRCFTRRDRGAKLPRHPPNLPLCNSFHDGRGPCAPGRSGREDRREGRSRKSQSECSHDRSQRLRGPAFRNKLA